MDSMMIIIYHRIRSDFNTFNQYIAIYHYYDEQIPHSLVYDFKTEKYNFLKNLDYFIFNYGIYSKNINNYKIATEDNYKFLIIFNVLIVLNKLINDEYYFNIVFNKDNEFILQLKKYYLYFKHYLISFILNLSNIYNNVSNILSHIKMINDTDHEGYEFLVNMRKNNLLFENRNLLIDFMKDEKIKNNEKVYQALFMFIMQDENRKD